MNFHPNPEPEGECEGQLMLPGFEDVGDDGAVPEARSSCCLGRCATVGRRPMGVWASGQQTSRIQRVGRYLPESLAHPARMLPAIARHLIETYTPHELVFDPMCGIGTTIIEAMHLGRSGVGIEYESRWAHLTQLGINRARTDGALGAGYVWNADARHLPEELAAAVSGQVKLLITSPPYGPSCHGQVAVEGRTGHTGPLVKTDDRYSRDRRNLAHRPSRDLLAGFTDILAAAYPLMAPGGIVAVTARPWRRSGHLIDLPAAVLRAGRIAGFTPVERCVALLGRMEQAEGAAERLVAHGSFFQLDSARRSNAAGVPRSLIVHEDVLVFSKEGI